MKSNEEFLINQRGKNGLKKLTLLYYSCCQCCREWRLCSPAYLKTNRPVLQPPPVRILKIFDKISIKIHCIYVRLMGFRNEIALALITLSIHILNILKYSFRWGPEKEVWQCLLCSLPKKSVTKNLFFTTISQWQLELKLLMNQTRPKDVINLNFLLRLEM